MERALSLWCAQHGHRLGGESPLGKQVTATEANRRAPDREADVKEAGSEDAGRRTETGFEVAPSRASGHQNREALVTKAKAT